MGETYLIAIDLDGTLLTEKQTIAPRTKAALAAARKAGHHIVISTGRPFRASRTYYQELQLNTPIINYNGAFVHHPRRPEWGVFHNAIAQTTASAIVTACEAAGVDNILAEVGDHAFLHSPDPFVADLFELKPPYVQTGHLNVLLKQDPTCLLIRAEQDVLYKVQKELAIDHDTVESRLWRAPFHCLEVIRKGMNKAVALQRVAHSLNVTRERIIAFGDEENDVEMLRFAGIGVAMGNAVQSAREAADEVTASNEEDGIALFLEQQFHLLQKK